MIISEGYTPVHARYQGATPNTIYGTHVQMHRHTTGTGKTTHGTQHDVVEDVSDCDKARIPPIHDAVVNTAPQQMLQGRPNAGGPPAPAGHIMGKGAVISVCGESEAPRVGCRQAVKWKVYWVSPLGREKASWGLCTR